MNQEKRRGNKPVPDNLNEILNERQQHKLRQMEGFGWSLEFVRRPLFQDPTVVVRNAEGNRIGTLEKDGSIDMLPDIRLRKQEREILPPPKSKVSGGW